MRFKIRGGSAVEELNIPTETDPKVMAIKDAVRKSRVFKAASEEFDAAKENLKKNVFPFGTPTTEHSWTYGFDRDDPEFANVTVQYQERTKPYIDLEEATRILKEKRLYSRCLTTPEPAPPPAPFLDEEKIMQLLSEEKLTPAEVRKMIKVSKKDTVKVILIKEPEAKRGKAGTGKKANKK